MQTRETKLHVLDGYDAESLQRAILNEVARLRDLHDAQGLVEEQARINNEIERLTQLFGVFNIKAGENTRLHVTQTI